ncbi:uncharacterized protein PSFLO_05852 [Pseudozyma flocculosa]|uniref:Uncharacterized protein n=1 Tax=Pseudozyma flocculosa TaxID=84751 RepID=A0A5C3F823_9BASI|nr:uncharacterized protein PSFLO_05852 [Pseudozyma flocculosa]
MSATLPPRVFSYDLRSGHRKAATHQKHRGPTLAASRTVAQDSGGMRSTLTPQMNPDAPAASYVSASVSAEKPRSATDSSSWRQGTPLAPQAFKKHFTDNTIKGQEVLRPAALILWAEAAELKAQRDASRTIEPLCSSLEERGELSTAGRLSPKAAFPGLLWPGEEEFEEDDIVGGRPGERALSGGRDQLTGLRYGPFGTHHPLKASLGHTNHLELSRLRDLHLDALHDDKPAPDQVDALVDAFQGLLAGVKATIQAWGSNSLIKSWLPTTLSVALSSCVERAITLADLSAFAYNGGEIGGGLGPPDHRGSVEGDTGGPGASSSRVTLDSGGGDGTGSAVATSSRVTLDSGGGGGPSSAFGTSGGTGNAIAGSSGVGGAVASTSRVALDSDDGTARSLAGSSGVAFARNLKHG